jgi:nucleoside 2-deoxyribosyltransferase
LKKPIKVYFGHPWITRIHGAAKATEEYLKMHLPNVEIINPFEVGDLTAEWIKNPLSIAIAKAIVRKDLSLLQECDIVISYFPDTAGDIKLNGGIGTPMELFYMRHVLNKPVYCLTPYRHPWLIALGVKTFSDIDELVETVHLEMQL